MPASTHVDSQVRPGRLRIGRFGLLALLVLVVAGCTPGAVIARQLRVAPARQPKWLTEPGQLLPEAPVTLTYYVPDPAKLIRHPWVNVGSPTIPLRLGIVEPGHHGFQPSGRWELSGRRPVFRFEMRLNPAAAPDPAPPKPRGTVIVLHGYGLSHDVLFPWGMALADAGWRCILVDLRGHGRSGGDTISFGVEETGDLIAMLDELERRQAIAGPIGVLGDSYGAALALRWATHDPRVRTVVAMAPYDRLDDAMEGLRKSYCPWVPRSWVRQASVELPRLMCVGPDALNTSSALGTRRFPAFLIAGDSDPVASQAGIDRLARLLGPETQIQRLPRSGHEEIPYEFDALNTPVRDWFDRHLR